MAVRWRRRDLDVKPDPSAAGAGAEPWAPCRAPSVSMRFSPTGEVRVCCANDKISLGRVGEVPLREIWEGRIISDLGAALDQGEYPHGCDDCAPGTVADRASTPADNFDRFPRQPRSGWPQRLEFALSNRCNLQCVMCNGELSSSIRIQREGRAPLPSAYGDEFYEEVRPFLVHLREAEFIGGEPFLEPGARRIWDLFLELGVRPNIHVTTNGTILTAHVERYVRELAMGIAVSIDAASRELFEAIRVGASFDTVIANRDRLRAITRETGAGFAINFCLMTNNWHELADMVVEADRLDALLQALPVLWPSPFSLFCLPDEELRVIVAQLDAVDAERRGSFGRNRGVWDQSLALLRDHLRRADLGTVPVNLRNRQVIRPWVVRPDEVIADLAERAGHPPVVVEGEGVDVDSVGTGLERWLGPPLAVAKAEDGSWQGTFDLVAGRVTIWVAALPPASDDQADGDQTDGDEAVDDPSARPGRVAVAPDCDPLRLLPVDPQALVEPLERSWSVEQHERLVQHLAEGLAASTGREPLRLELTEGRIDRADAPAWLDLDEAAVTGTRSVELVLPGCTGPATGASFRHHAPLVAEGEIELPTGAGTVVAHAYVVRRPGTSSATTLLAPDRDLRLAPAPG
ncbi:radical SAM protein [Aquihabitans sp. McL0605]|uniref:radical SAM protein n=1 Tax=Aquihabitans sp. McL0605 TaxID=3415671 RepID=UPI003CEE366B